MFSVAKLVSDVKKSLLRADYAEIRLDFLNPSQIPSCLKQTEPYLDRCVCTLRPKSEGGKFQGSEKERVSILKLIAEFEPHLLDVEFNTLRKDKKLHQYLKRTGVDILISWHDFTKTPSEQQLKSMAKKMSSLSKNIKIVTTARTIGDTLRILNLYKGVPHRLNLIAFAMGDYGMTSRILCTRLGSPFTYVSLGKPIAPGQLSLDEMKSIFKLQK